jgi:hypothetical protein
MNIIEKDGKRFVADKDFQVLKDDKGNEVVYDPKKHKDDLPDLSQIELEQLAKTNPHVARVLQERDEAAKKAKELADAEEAKRQDDARKNGEWQKLAEEAETKRKKLEDDLIKANEIVKNHKGTIEHLLNQVLEGVPKEKQSLIPVDYSPRKKLEYIMSNATALGVEPVIKTKGTKIPGNDNPPPATAEAQLMAEIDELNKKPNRTPSENNLLWEKSKKLKEVRAAKQ